MAEVEKATQLHKGKAGKEVEVEEKWVKYYSSLHEILLVGEGDFSFSTCLAQSFGSASNIVASSKDSYDNVIKNFKNAESNLSILDKLGASHLHEVDATKMKFHSNLSMRKFDRIIFNFPHAGFYRREDNSVLIGMHQRLLYGFFKNASGMLRPNGEIHVNHKTSIPYCHWNLEELASHNSLRLNECVALKKEDYPGYENKRGSGSKCDEQFILGECCTFKFSFSPNAKVTRVNQNMKRPQKLAKAPKFVSRQPNPFEFRHPSSDLVTLMSNNTPALNIPFGRSLDLQTAIRASQQGNPFEFGHPSSDLVMLMSNTSAFNIPHGRSRDLLQTSIRASQQGNYLEHGKPREVLQAPICTYQQAFNIPHGRSRDLLQTYIRASQQGNYLEHGKPREVLQAPICAYQQGNYLAYRNHPSDINLHMSGIPGYMGSPHIDHIYLECSRIFSPCFERVAKALTSPDHNSSYFLKEALQLGYKRFIAGDPRRTQSDYTSILEQLRRYIVGRQAGQLSWQVTVKCDPASNSRIGPSK